MFESLTRELKMQNESADEEIVMISEELETPGETGDDIETNTSGVNINDVDDMAKDLKDSEDIDIDDIEGDEFSDLDIDEDEEDDEIAEEVMNELTDNVLLEHCKTLDEEIDNLLDEEVIINEACGKKSSKKEECKPSEENLEEEIDNIFTADFEDDDESEKEDKAEEESPVDESTDIDNIFNFED